MVSLVQELKDALATPDQLRAWLNSLPRDSHPIGFAKAPYTCPIAKFIHIVAITKPLDTDNGEMLFIADDSILVHINDHPDEIRIPITGWLWTFRFLIDEEPIQYQINRGRALQLLADAEQDPAAA